MKEIHILIIDNDQVNSFVLKNIITRNYATAKVTLVANGAEALKNLENNVQRFPDIILLDIYMPIMDGFEFLEQYTNLYAHKESLIFTMSNSLIKEDQQKANSFSVVKGFITKPLIYNNIQFIIESLPQDDAQV